MNSLISSIEAKFNKIDEKRVGLINQTGLVENYFDRRLNELEKEASNSLNEARDVLLERVKAHQIRLLSDPWFDEETNWARFKPCDENFNDSILFNFDELNPNGNFNRDLVDFVRYSDFYVPRLNKIRFTEPYSHFRINRISVLTIGKIFIDLNFVRNEDEMVPLKRKLIIINPKGERLHEVIRPKVDDLKSMRFIAKNRIYILDPSETDSDSFKVDIFDFKLNLKRTVLLNKDIRRLLTNQDEICMETTKSLKFYDLDLNFKKAIDKRHKTDDFYTIKLKLLSFNEKILCFFEIVLSNLIFMSRQVDDVVSQVQVYFQFPFRSSDILFNLGNDQMMYLNNLYSTTSQPNAIVMNSRGEILIEKPLPFFVSDISRTAYGTIVMKKGTINVARSLKQDNVEKIKFKTF